MTNQEKAVHLIDTVFLESDLGYDELITQLGNKVEVWKSERKFYDPKSIFDQTKEQYTRNLLLDEFIKYGTEVLTQFRTKWVQKLEK